NVDSHSENERRGAALLNPHRERRGTLVSRRDDTVSLGCSGYREDTSGRTPARHGRLCKRDFARQRETDLTICGAQHIMEATEDWVGYRSRLKEQTGIDLRTGCAPQGADKDRRGCKVEGLCR
ncbi:hypothetical protein K469DRAFT_705120, partial [Zopfia rhizophila CBS 207.26]